MHSLHEQGESDPAAASGDLVEVGWVSDRLRVRHGYACRHGGAARARFVSDDAERFGARTGEGDPLFLEQFAQLRLLAEESVSGMDDGSSRLHGGLGDQLRPQVGGSGGAGTDDDGRVGALSGEAVPVGGAGGDNGSRTDAVRGLDDANGDLAAVGDEDGRPVGHEPPSTYAIG